MKRVNGVRPGTSDDVIGHVRGRRRNTVLALTLTGAAHLIALTMLLLPRAELPPSQAEPSLSLIEISLAETPKPKPPGPPEATEIESGRDNAVLPTPPEVAAQAPVLDAPTTLMSDNSDLLSESQLAGASSAGAGGAGGGACNMAHLVQQALQRDPLVRTAVLDANRLGKSIMLWNGDWVQSGAQEGKGLSAVREAVLWEVAFAPEACRNQRMQGLVLLSLADEGTRFGIGAGDWRWSDLLGLRGVRSQR